MRLLSDFICIPVCPEQLGGLPTPRPPAAFVGGDGSALLDGKARLLDPHGRDLSQAFLRGAESVLCIARLQHVQTAFLKNGSPSCGGPPHFGVTAALLMRERLEVFWF